MTLLKWMIITSGLIIVLGLLLSYGRAFADPPPAQLCASGYAAPCQTRPDTFQYNGQSLDIYNALSTRVRQTGVVHWAYKIESGCVGGNIGRNIGAAMGDLYYNTGVVSEYVTNGTEDLVIRVNCGISFQAVCGGGSVIACLGRGFPGNLDIDISDRMNDFFDLSQIAIVCHEYCGHALATWNEQYLDDGSFSANPNWIDIMSTGPPSRHLLGPIELARWGRTMGTPAPLQLGRSEEYAYFCSPSNYALYVDLFGWTENNYRYIGTVFLRDLTRSPNNCFGLQTTGYIAPSECPAIRLGNMVDWKQAVFRSDRVLC